MSAAIFLTEWKITRAHRGYRVVTPANDCRPWPVRGRRTASAAPSDVSSFHAPGITDG